MKERTRLGTSKREKLKESNGDRERCGLGRERGRIIKERERG